MKYIISIFSAAILLSACGSGNSKSAIPDAGDAIPVRLLAVNADTSAGLIEASGLLSTENQARLSFKIGGVIDAILVKEGQFVRQGQLLATLKSTEISAQVQQVELALEKAKRDYQRASNLYKDSVATLEQLQNSKTGVDIATQNLQQVNFNAQYARITAPSDGFIVKKIANTGELAGPGTPILFMSSVAGNSKWILRTGVSDKEWAAAETGNAATVTFDAFPGKTFSATVSKKALAADEQSGSFLLELQVEFGKEQPALGLFGKAQIHTSGRSIGFSVPYEALLEANGKNGYVFVSDDRKTVKRVPVIISSISNNTVYIASGLEGHSWVVSAGSPYLTDGSAIKVIQ